MRRSAGVLLRRPADGHVLLVHPGGPFWARKDAGAWSIPKGEYDETEDPEACARREFHEELGASAPASLVDLGTVRQKNRKEVRAFYGEGDLDVAGVVSNTFEMEWPPRSGKTASFPEIDRAEWFPVEVAREKLIAAQAEFLDRLP
ncbi:MAG TPA: NUDIX domain-containing protein [Solirubrobacteraceae bacterium]|nr:NUDIX domain-containing protein [Solirubrobacteraceae bacterium]